MSSWYIDWGGRRAGRATLRKQAASTPQAGWAAQQLGLPIAWYENVSRGSGAEFPVSGDQTARSGRAARFAKKLGFDVTPWQERLLAMDPNDTPRRDVQPPEVP